MISSCIDIILDGIFFSILSKNYTKMTTVEADGWKINDGNRSTIIITLIKSISTRILISNMDKIIHHYFFPIIIISSEDPPSKKIKKRSQLTKIELSMEKQKSSKTKMKHVNHFVHVQFFSSNFE